MTSKKIVRAIIARFDLLGNFDRDFNRGKGITLGTGLGSTMGLCIEQSSEHICISGLQREEPPLPPWTDIVSKKNYFALKLNQSDGSMYTPFGGIGLCVRPLPDPLMGIDATWVTTPVGMAMTEDGKVTLCGGVESPSDEIENPAAFVRLTAKGAFDHTFGISGVVLEDQTTSAHSTFYGFVRMPSGGLIAGFLRNSSTNKLDFIHYDPPNEDTYHSIADFGIQTILTPRRIFSFEDSVYVAGRARQDGEKSTSYFIARLNSTGHPDPAFGTGGIVVSKFGTANIEIHALHVSHSGICIAGYAGGHEDTLALAKYTFTGIRDTTFSGDGKRLVTYESIKDLNVSSLAVSVDGTIYVGGSAKQKVFLAAFKANGDTFDSFGENTLPVEIGTLLFEYFDRPDGADPKHFACTSLALSPDGKKLVICGYSTED
ncbi:delta-60 repeat domain-containing protein [Pseudomonas sp. NFACC39-1]|nr:delta-60 repeat domain-containing protein [Pseudomonas sp. NFACC39-1]